MKTEKIDFLKLIEKLGGRKKYLEECENSQKQNERQDSYKNIRNECKDGFGIDHSDVLDFF